MNKVLYLILLVVLISSCKTNSEPIEIDLNNCLLNSLSKKEKKQLSPIIKGFEKHLIEKGILESDSPEAYLNLYKKIAETGKYDFSNEYSFSEKIDFLDRGDPLENIGQFNCYDSILRTEKYRKSNLYKLDQEMQTFRGNRTTPLIIAQATVKYMEPKDFEFEYNRMLTLLFVEFHAE